MIKYIKSNLVRATVVLTMSTGCALVTNPYVDKTRDYKADAYSPAPETAAAGSLFSAHSPGLFQDTRAAGLGDIITIKVDENAASDITADTQLSRDSSAKLTLPAALGLAGKLAKVAPGVDAASLFNAELATAFNGSGKTSRTGTLTATIQARVKKMLPNGDLYLEGHKVISMNHEDHHLYISGVIRQEDVGPDNSVASARVADAQVIFNGEGQVSEQQREGWLVRLLHYLSPL